MPTDFDPSDFVDSDFQPSRKAVQSPPMSGVRHPGAERPPSREEVETRVSETQVKLAELKRAQEELERERASLEELRRRQMEYTNGREEMLQSLTRGLGLLEEAEFAARRDAEQMAKALSDLKDALDKVQSLNDQSWSKDSFNVELTRALTTIENARMEWNAARLKFPALSGASATETAPAAAPASLFAAQTFGQLFKLGLALTWPLVLVGLGIFLMLLLR